MKIGILGDIYAGNISEVNIGAENYINDYSKSSILPVLQNLDYVIGNLEAPVTKSNTPIHKTGPAIKHSDEIIELLKLSNIKYVTLANNHIYDFGRQGIEDTLKICSQNDIKTVGAGLNLDDIIKPIIIEYENKKIAFINAAENEFNTIDINNDFVGSNKLDLIELYKQVKNIRDKVDFLIMVFHGGHEEYHYPSPRIKELYSFFIDIGCDAVVAHHPHVIQGVEIYKEKPIFYSTGNYFFPSLSNIESNKLGYVVILNFSNKKIDFEIIPYQQCSVKNQVNILNDGDNAEFSKRLNDLSEVITDDKKLNKKWYEFVEQRKISFLQSLIPLHKKLAYRFFQYPILLKLLPKKYFLKILNLIRCESHRDILINSLRK